MNKDDAKRWLEYAEKDLSAARILLESTEFFPRQICFLAQQVAEKSVKAVLVFAEVNFPKTHDLDRLRDLMPIDWKFKEQFPDLAELTIWSVESRYPGDMFSTGQVLFSIIEKYILTTKVHKVSRRKCI